MAEKKLNGTVIVTYRCNARCSMCNRYKAPSKPEEEISIDKKIPEEIENINDNPTRNNNDDFGLYKKYL